MLSASAKKFGVQTRTVAKPKHSDKVKVNGGRKRMRFTDEQPTKKKNKNSK